jgi:hypothetical protein
MHAGWLLPLVSQSSGSALTPSIGVRESAYTPLDTQLVWHSVGFTLMRTKQHAQNLNNFGVSIHSYPCPGCHR